MPAIVDMQRVETFSAAHRLHSNQLTDEENRQTYGKCNNPNGHGHNYVWKVILRGPVDEITGMVYDLSQLKNDMQTVLNTVDHRNIDKDIEWFKTHVSTSENLAIYLYNSLKEEMKRPELLYKVILEETPKNIFTYRGE